MQLLVCAPGIKGEEARRRILAAERMDLLYLTNPLYQRERLSPGELKRLFKIVVEDDDISSDDYEFGRLIELSKYFAGNWFSQKIFRDKFLYKGVNLAAIFTVPLSLYLVKILKCFFMYQKLLEKYPIKNIIILDDGSEWVECVKYFEKSHGIEVRVELGKIKLMKEAPRFNLKRAFKIGLSFVNRLSMNVRLQNGIIYSCALKYMAPFIGASHARYYLRDTFSVKAAFLGAKGSFVHLTPSYLAKSNSVDHFQVKLAMEELYRDVDRYFSQSDFFVCRENNLWPILKSRFYNLMLVDMCSSMKNIDFFRAMFEKLRPRAVIVDEEVCPFNKSLILTANILAIKTYCLVHGVPLESIGSIPSSADAILAWGSTTKKRLMQWGISPEKILEVGAPQMRLFDQKDHERCRKEVISHLKIKSVNKIIFFAATSFDTNENPIFVRTSIGMKVQKDTLMIAIDLLRLDLSAHLIVKFHPHESNVIFTEKLISDLKDDLVARIHLVKDYDAAALISASDLVVSVASTVYFEALLMEKPVVNLDYHDQRYCPFMEDRFVNLNDSMQCKARMQDVFVKEAREKLLDHQRVEIKRHFYNENKEAAKNILRLVLAQ